MKTDFSKTTWQFLVVISLVCVIALTAMIIQTVVRFFSPPPETKIEESAVTVAAQSGETARKREEVKSVSADEEHSFVSPISAPVPAAHSSLPPKTAERADFNTDFKTIQEREKGRRETIENLRKQAGENPDSNAVPLEKQLKKIEDSGADFL